VDFVTVVDQVIALLRQRGRVAYRTLQRQFQLDDEALADLKIELIDAQHLARDEQGRILVWVGDAATPLSPAPSAAQHAPQAEPYAGPVSQRASASSVPHTSEAERRQLTVLFCDLVDSTPLSSQLDPEDLREVVRAYQAACDQVIQRYGGYIAQYLGDGLLIYFGYPQAYEDDARRAVYTSLEILAALEQLHPRLRLPHGARLAVRLGIHTGLVVVGELGGSRREQLALGETPNIAARLQGLAAPNTIVISGATFRLIEGYFACRDLGTQQLRGVATPLQVYQILKASEVQSRLEVTAPRGLTPLVGREAELALLQRRWAQVKEGMGQVVLLHGEPGIGKSRLVQVLKDHLVAEAYTRLECRCSPYHQHTPLYPVIDFWERRLHVPGDDTPAAKGQRLEATLADAGVSLQDTVPLLAALLSLPLPAEQYPSLQLTPQQQRHKTLETIGAILCTLAAHQPVLLVLEDLHWVDPSTLELLRLLVEHSATVRILVLLTFRPDFSPPWPERAYLTSLPLLRLPHGQAVEMTGQVAHGKALPPEVVEQVVTKTDGVPLFVEELTKMVLESGLLQEHEDRYTLVGPLPPLAIPTTLQDSLMARLDRLSAVKTVAQLGATIGRTFSYALLQAVAALDEAVLQHSLQQLVEAELVYQYGAGPQATYAFKHALVQDTAYQTLLRSTRRHYHHRIAQALVTHFATAETQPELVAHHYTEADLAAQAVAYWQRAGQRAVEHSAYVEARSHLTKGLEVLQTLPDSLERTQHELSLQTALGTALIAIQGYAAPEVEHTYTRARALCQHLGDTPRLLQVLLGLHAFYVVRGQFQTAWELGEQCLALVPHVHSPTRLLNVHYALGVTLFHRGEFAAARAHLDQGTALYEAPRHRPHPNLQDPGVICLAYGAWTLLVLGYPDQAMTRVQEARLLAQRLAHPFSLAFALHCVTCVHQMRREARDTQEQAQAVLTLSTEQGFPFWHAYAIVLQGWARVERGQAEGLAQMQQGLGTWQAQGAEVGRTWSLAMLAEAYGRAGRTEAGLTVLADALAAVARMEERFGEAELYRLTGELLLRAGPQPPASEVVPPDAPRPLPDTAAEACFHYALAIARRQQAKVWELRAARSLSRLWQQQGKDAEARELLAPIYGWFTEGFDTADLQEAKALLEELGG